MTTALDARWRDGLCELAVYPEVDGAPVRVQARVVRRRRRRRAIGAGVTCAWVLVGLFAVTTLAPDDAKRPIQVGPGEDPSTPVTTAPDDRAPTTPVRPPPQPPDAPEKDAADAGARSVPPRAQAPRATVPAAAGEDDAPVSPTTSATRAPVPSGAPSTATTTPTPTTSVSTQPTTPATTTSTTTTTTPLTTTGSEIPVAGPKHLVVVLDDNGLRSSSPRMDAGTFEVSFVDIRTAPARRASLTSTAPANFAYSGVSLRSGWTRSITLPIVEDIALVAFELQRPVSESVPLHIGLPAGRGLATEPADRVGLEIKNGPAGGMTLVARDNIQDIVDPYLIGNPDHVPVARVTPGAATIVIRNRTRENYELRLTRYAWYNLEPDVLFTVRRGTTKHIPVGFTAGGWYQLRPATDYTERAWPQVFLIAE